MKIGKEKVNFFKIKNRKGFAAICCGHLTEGSSREQAFSRLAKAMKRTGKIKDSCC